MLIFNDWQIKNDGTLIARQYDNLSRRLRWPVHGPVRRPILCPALEIN